MSCLNKPNYSTSTTLPLAISSTSKCTKTDNFLSDIIAAVTLDDTPLCGSCEEGSPATSKCTECSEMLCDPCVRAHQRVRITKDHRIERFLNDLNLPHTSAGSLGSSRASSSPCNAMNNFCDIHREPHRLYCETCLLPYCSECSITERCGHQLIYIQEAIENARMINPRLTADMRSAIAIVRDAIENVQSMTENIELQSLQVISEIRTAMRRCIASLEERQHELVSHVEQIRQYKGKFLVTQIEKLRLVLSRLINTSEFLTESMETTNNMDIIIANEKASNELKQIKGMHKQLLPCEDHNIVFIPPDNNFLRLISTIGNVTSTGRNLAVFKNHMKETVPYLPTICEADLFRASTRNHPIYGISSPIVVKHSGLISVVAFGSEGEADGQLCRPWGVCCNQLGQIIVADRSNNRVQIFNANGGFHLKFGSHGTGPGQFDRPAGVAVNLKGDIIVADKDNHRIQVFKGDGTFILQFGEKGGRNGQFNYPWDVACNSQGNIVVSDTRNHRIQLFTGEGIFLNKYGFEGTANMWKHFDSPRGVCFTPTGNIIVTDFNNHRLVVIDSHFMQAQFLGQEGSNFKQFLRPQGIVCDDEGNIIVADSRNNRIQVFESNGNFLWKVGQAGKSLGDLDRPSGICLNPEGRIVVVDFGNNRIQIF